MRQDRSRKVRLVGAFRRPYAMPDPLLLNVLAHAFLAGEQTVDQVTARSTVTLGRPWRWLRTLAQRYLAAFADRTRPRQRDVIRFFQNDAAFARIRKRYADELSIHEWLAGPQHMLPVAATATWDIPPIVSAGALAEWLQVTPGELGWFADLKGLGYRSKTSPLLRHYHYLVLAKASGGIRLIESPKLRLKELQRRILTGILDRIPQHSAAHGFRQGRSIKTFVAPHVGQRVVLRMDLRDFFPSISGARVQSFFRTAGYPESVADLLGGICSNATPLDVWRQPSFDVDPRELREARALYRRPHLPQGAPTSPALANICAFRADCRLAGLAESAGAQYTRYADDMAFSGGEEFERRVQRFSTHVAVILHEEGFDVHHRKTRIMRQGVRQHLAGLVANQSVNIIRADFDRLKAILNNCVRLGPASQNRDAHPSFRSHLAGRIGFVEMINPSRGKRLRTTFDRIVWP
jgi:RNA-directed DNA polymerase